MLEFTVYNLPRLTKIGQKKIGKTLSGLMSLDFCNDIQMVGSEFGVNNTTESESDFIAQ